MSNAISTYLHPDTAVSHWLSFFHQVSQNAYSISTHILNTYSIFFFKERKAQHFDKSIQAVFLISFFYMQHLGCYLLKQQNSRKKHQGNNSFVPFFGLSSLPRTSKNHFSCTVINFLASVSDVEKGWLQQSNSTFTSYYSRFWQQVDLICNPQDY